MSHNSPSPQNFEILCDSPLAEDNQSPQAQELREADPTESQPFGHLSITQSQNRSPGRIRVAISTHELDQVCLNPHSGGILKNSNKKTRPPIASTTFEVLDTVPASELQTQTVPALSRASDDAQQTVTLPVEQYSSHPLSIAARITPPLEEQLAKHRDGLFEWILAVRVPSNAKSQRDSSSGTNDSADIRKVYFGCNILPQTSPGKSDGLVATCPAGSYLLLITPLEETEEVLEVFRDPIGDPDMALPAANISHSTPVKISDRSPVYRPEQATPDSLVCNRGDSSSARSITPRSPSDPVTRIEDSFEALDRLEEQLEAFHIDQYIHTEKPPSINEAVTKAEPPKTSPSVKFTTPQPKRTYTKSSGYNCTSLQVKPASEPRRALRKSASMMLDLHKLKAEDKTRVQTLPKPHTVRDVGDLSPHRLGTKSTKQPTVPTFELPGDTVARELKEKKQARLASQRATQPTAASLRRAKSAKLPTRPAFELPGEAISRRKREEHQAQLKSQAEEEKKRREFKARPMPPTVVHTTATPRETIASRARQNKAALAENSAQTLTPNHHLSTNMNARSRSALSNTINQPQSRGRELGAEESFIRANRATSTSTCRSVSIKDVQMQKLRGHQIYQRDNSFTDNRMRERREREALAKIAREGAAEKSRQQGREWAAKQVKKRMMITSHGDTMA